MNELERAVIEAARAWLHATPSTIDTVNRPLRLALEALESHQRALTAAGLTEVNWAVVAEGDELRGKSGEFYPVVATKREWQMGKPTGNFLITIRQGALNRGLTRGAAHGKATVRRGAAGVAVDLINHVMSSGER